MAPVESSDTRAFGFDEWSGTLTVAFHSGGVSEYHRAPYSEHCGLMAADSHGKYFHENIRNHDPCRRLE